ncbi:membrane protease YdiL (CAAX protease family) [Aureimonas pseudogalii]|uniref:Membrane protease YdiL (CAAX protease family) n=1 Tax=Aureimonas pseudogalii TaxID=1744844 RepID=A0A7W6H9J7_9HYPH|nr:membrane protease YdiL (CAAX protease family) [Aureimonas pseudogalii]
MPWFVFGFMVMVVLNSVLALPDSAREILVPAASVLLAMALAAMGLATDIGKLRAMGLRALALGAVGWVFITFVALGGVLLVSKAPPVPLDESVAGPRLPDRSSPREPRLIRWLRFDERKAATACLSEGRTDGEA